MSHIDYTTTPYTYYDKEGNTIHDGDIIRHADGYEEKVYLLSDEKSLGTDATNPKWIEDGRAEPCEYGCYPLYAEDLEDCIVIR